MAKKLAFDKMLFAAVVLLLGLGLTMVYSASGAVAQGSGRAAYAFLIKQGVAAALGLVLMVLVMYVDYRRWNHPVVALGGLGVVLVLLVAALFGPELNNTRRWLFVGGMSIQPSEIAKLAVVPFVAYLVVKKRERENELEFLLPCAIGVGLVLGLIVLGRDLGSALLLVLVGGSMLFLSNMRWVHMSLGGLVAAPTSILLVLAEPYRRERLTTFLDPERDPLDAGYQVTQSLIAVGSGGLFGVGLGKSMQKLFFLPYPHSDFMFATIAEELGLVGGLTVLCLFGILLWRGARAGLRAPDDFGRYLAWGLTAMLVAQALIHISVSLALLPTTGITLPLVSYGGSSLVVSLLSCGLILNVSQHG